MVNVAGRASEAGKEIVKILEKLERDTGGRVYGLELEHRFSQHISDAGSYTSDKTSMDVMVKVLK